MLSISTQTACTPGKQKQTLVALSCLRSSCLGHMQAMEESYTELAKRFQKSSHVRIAKYQADTDRDFASQKFGLKTFPTLVLMPKSQSSGVIRYPTERRDTDSLQMWLNTMTGYEA